MGGSLHFFVLLIFTLSVGQMSIILFMSLLRLLTTPFPLHACLLPVVWVCFPSLTSRNWSHKSTVICLNFWKQNVGVILEKYTLFLSEYKCSFFFQIHIFQKFFEKIFPLNIIYESKAVWLLLFPLLVFTLLFSPEVSLLFSLRCTHWERSALSLTGAVVNCTGCSCIPKLFGVSAAGHKPSFFSQSIDILLVSDLQK